MTTKRFKAVCTETGREFLPEHQGLQDGPDMRVSHLKKRKGKILHHWPLQVWVTAECTNRVELCQSTGLHDANGQEVFFGDVVLINDLICVIDFHYCAIWAVEFRENYFYSASLQKVRLNEMWATRTKVIGNRWQPHEQLQEAAEKIAK